MAFPERFQLGARRLAGAIFLLAGALTRAATPAMADPADSQTIVPAMQVATGLASYQRYQPVAVARWKLTGDVPIPRDEAPAMTHHDHANHAGHQQQDAHAGQSPDMSGMRH